MRRVRAAVRSAGARPHAAPVILLGNQKSGTTAIAGLLSKLTARPATLDFREEARRLDLLDVRAGAMTFEHFIRRNKIEFSRPIVKEPALTPFYTELKRYIPKATFVFIVRDPRDNIRSILNRLGLPGHLAQLDQDDVRRLPLAWRKNTLEGAWLGLNGENYIATLAGRWELFARIYLDNSGDILLVRYEDFLLDKVFTIEQLATRTGLEPTDDISQMIDVQFQPQGNRDVDRGQFFGRENLDRIVRRCSEAATRLGYDLRGQ